MAKMSEPTMKHYVLFHATAYTGPEKDSSVVMRAFGEAFANLEAKSKDTKRLGTHSWLIDRASDVAILARLVNRAEADRLEYQVLFLTESSN
jgi:hypothetical protein